MDLNNLKLSKHKVRWGDFNHAIIIMNSVNWPVLEVMNCLILLCNSGIKFMITVTVEKPCIKMIGGLLHLEL